MEVSVSDAEGLLTELIRRAETGEDVVITRDGQPVVRLVRAKPSDDAGGAAGGVR